MRLFVYKGERVNVRHSIDEHPNPADFPMHAHQQCELYVFVSGNGHYSVEGNDYLLRPGTVLIMREGETHKLHIQPDTTYERLTINFPLRSVCAAEGELYAMFYRRPLGTDNLFLPDENAMRYINDNLSKIMSYSGGSEAEEKIEYYLTGILLELLHLRKSDESATDESDSQATRSSSELVSSIIAFINSNLTEIKGLEVFEQRFFFSKSYLNRVFKESTGSSIWDYVVLKRLLLARSFMREGKPATMAAAECGFCDYSSFYRQYKRRFGTSPISDRIAKDRAYS